ncbi:MAG: DUF4189 domain-containing protein [Leptospirales bacterium]|nr:DUF4189 domain-containing protein [Leptospirales bacterium]
MPLNRLLRCLLMLTAMVAAASLGAASAVAWSEEAYGYAYNVRTVEEAERLAMQACNSNGCATNVRILASSAGEGHGALAADGNILGVALGFPDHASAASRALSECHRQGGKSPRVIFTWYDRGY